MATTLERFCYILIAALYQTTGHQNILKHYAILEIILLKSPKQVKRHAPMFMKTLKRTKWKQPSAK